MSSQVTGVGTSSEGEFGANEWLVEELYEQFTNDKNSVDKAWWPVLEAYKPSGSSDSGASSAPAAAPAAAAPSAPAAESNGTAPAASATTPPPRLPRAPSRPRPSPVR